MESQQPVDQYGNPITSFAGVQTGAPTTATTAPTTGTWAGVGAPAAPEPMSQYRDLFGNPISQAQADRTANFQSGGSLYQQALEEERAMREGVAKIRAGMNPAGSGVATNGGTGSTGSGGTTPFAGVQDSAPGSGGSVQAPSTGGTTTPGSSTTTSSTTSSGATTFSVNPQTMTVAGQLESVLANDSPLMQQARTRAMQAMNARGLSNSSMALGAADSAMYDKALEIAKPDASTYYDAGKTNVGYDNQFKMADKTQGFDLAKIKAQGDESRQTAKYVADTEARYKSLTQGSSAATSLLTKMQDSINAVWANDKITDKTTVINDIRKNTEESLNLIGAMAGDMDLSSYIKSIGGGP